MQAGVCKTLVTLVAWYFRENIKETETIVNLTVNHYRNVDHFGYKGLINFLKSVGREVFERELTEEEMERAFCAAMTALFND